MDPKEKQRMISMISDYNAYKSSGGRLYEITVERDTDADFVCKGVLRLYWDIQRPIVLNKEATSSFVQKRERSSNIVGRPAGRMRREESKSEETSASGVSQMAGKAFANDTITDISPRSKAKGAQPEHISPIARPTRARTETAGSAASHSKAKVLGRRRSSDQSESLFENAPPLSPSGRISPMAQIDKCRLGKVESAGPAQTRTHIGLHLPFEFARSSSVGSPLRSNSFGAADKKQRQKDSVATPRIRTKSSTENASPKLGNTSSRLFSPGRPNSIESPLRPTSSNSNVASSAALRTRNGSNLSRVFTSSFKRPKSMKPVITPGQKDRSATVAATAGPAVPVLTKGRALQASNSATLLDPASSLSAPGASGVVSSPSSLVSPPDGLELLPKPVKKRGTSFRKSFQRSISPKRRQSLQSDEVTECDIPTNSGSKDTLPSPGAATAATKTSGTTTAAQSSSSSSSSLPASAIAVPAPSLTATEGIDKSLAACSGGGGGGGSRLGNFLSRPRISFRLRRNNPSRTDSMDSVSKLDSVACSPPPSSIGAESLAEFYQPPKGSVTNIRATSDMTVSDIISATLSKLNAVDEPSRFAIFSIDDTGTVKIIQDDVCMLLYRIRLGPKEDVCKLFIMERNTSDAQDFSAEVMQYYHLGMPFLERLVTAYQAEEEREIDRIRLKFADNRRRLEKKLETAAKAEVIEVDEPST
eukprot:scpid77947/ scgid33552/ Ras association domain-containing protein 2